MTKIIPQNMLLVCALLILCIGYAASLFIEANNTGAINNLSILSMMFLPAIASCLVFLMYNHSISDFYKKIGIYLVATTALLSTLLLLFIIYMATGTGFTVSRDIKAYLSMLPLRYCMLVACNSSKFLRQ